MLNIAHITITEVEGPGKRVAIWFQGCLKNCQYCCNIHMIDIRPIKLVSEKWLIDYIESVKKQVEGITLLGGEPFLQAKGIIEVLKKIDKKLSIIAFSGYTFNELKILRIERAKELLQYLDVLIDGEYDYTQEEDNRRWIGSKNQNIYFFTNRYNIKDFKNKVDEIEFHFKKNKIFVNGFPIKNMG